MKQFFLLIFLLITFWGCAPEKEKDTELNNLVSLFVGEFSNEEQVIMDKSYRFLSMVNVRIWKDRPGYWTYSEVFEPNNNNYIFSQRIINYRRIDSLNFASTSYSLKDAKNSKYTGKNSKVFDKITMGDLIVKNGCDVYYKKKTPTIYTGKTIKGDCDSTISKINYITSSFVISRDKISIWTRGFDDRDKQVWGKVEGPYVYKKLSN